MRCFQTLLALVSLITLAVGVNTAAPPYSSAASTAAARSWTADNGNGTYSNPLFYEEFEDPDVIRVGEDYYLAGTTMHMNPALIVLHSKDLVNWELASYCMDRLDLGPAFRLEGGNMYGRGIWAPCICYHNGMFYVFSNVNGVGCQVFRSKSANGPWARNQLPGMHDLSVLFDAGSDTFPLDVAAAWTADRKVLTIAIINPTESAQTLSLQIRGADLAGKDLLRRMAPQSLTATVVVGQEPGVKIEEQSVDQIPTNTTFAPFSVNSYPFPEK